MHELPLEIAKPASTPTALRHPPPKEKRDYTNEQDTKCAWFGNANEGDVVDAVDVLVWDDRREAQSHLLSGVGRDVSFGIAVGEVRKTRNQHGVVVN